MMANTAWIALLTAFATCATIAEAADGCKLCPSLSRVCPGVIATMPAEFDCAYLDAFALSLRSVRDDSTSAACEQDMTNTFCAWLSRVADSNQRTQCSGGVADLATAKMCPSDCAAISSCLAVPAMWNCADTFYASSPSSPMCVAIDSSSSGGSLAPNSTTPLAPDDAVDGSLGAASAPSASQSLDHNLWFVLFLVTASVLVLCGVASGLYARRLLKQRRVATQNLARANYSVGEPLSVQLGGTDVPASAVGGSRTPRAKTLSPPLQALSPRLLAASSAAAASAASPLASPTGAQGSPSPNPASPTASPNGQIILPIGSPFALHLQHLSYPAAASPSPLPISPPPRAAIQSPTGYEMSRERALGSPSGFTSVSSSLSPPPPLPSRTLPPPPPPPMPSAPRPQRSPTRLLEQMSPKARAGFQRVDG